MLTDGIMSRVTCAREAPQVGARAKAQNAEAAAASSAVSCGISLSEDNEEKYR